MNVLVTGCARDGTTSATRIISDFYAANGRDAVTMHESTHRPLYRAINAWVERRDAEPARAALGGWTHEAECGNGPAFLMPIVREIWGPGLKVVLLVRERESHLDSLCRRPLVNPQNWGGYVDHPAPAIRRPTAVDFGEMTANQWAGITVRQRLDYYVAKTHALVRAAAPLFDHYLELPTEELSTPERLCRFIEPSGRPVPGKHVNRSAPVDYRQKTQDELRAIERTWFATDGLQPEAS